MQASDRRDPALDGDERKQALTCCRGRWAADPRLWSGCVDERTSGGLSQSRSLGPPACDPSRQPGKRAPSRHRWPRNRNDRWSVYSRSYRPRTRAVGAFDAVFGGGTTPRRSGRLVSSRDHCGDGRDGRSPYACVRDDVARGTRRVVDARREREYHDRCVLARLRPATHHRSRSLGLRPYPRDNAKRSDLSGGETGGRYPRADSIGVLWGRAWWFRRSKLRHDEPTTQM
jgi:hypothetical protein